jgi:phosphatidate cytidylyltransferase
MLRTRLVVGTALILWGLAVLFPDARFAPWYPILFVFAVTITLVLARELQQLLPEAIRPRTGILSVCMLLLVISNWSAPIGLPGSSWVWVGTAAVCTLFVIFLSEAWYYREPGAVTQRIALTFLSIVYIGVFSSFLIQMRWGLAFSVRHITPDLRETDLGIIALLLTIFVPKCCDIGAYFTGRLIGRHQMAPVLSPKKTWEGAIGGLILAGLTSVLITHGIAGWLSLDSAEHPEFPLRLNQIAGMPGWLWSLIFGLVIGIVGMLGDLMESLIKRDLERKDAGATIPGFGGLLDVFDSILFSAPASYFFLVWLTYMAQRNG